MTTPPLSPVKHSLPDALHHVLYEMEMLFGARDLLPDPPEFGILQNVALESLIVHARCLEEFFSLSTDPKGRNMRAVDFSPTWTLAEPIHEDVINRMNREISHLGWTRKSYGAASQGWSAAEIIHVLAETSILFLGEVRKDKALMGFAKNQAACDSLIARFQHYRKTPGGSPALYGSPAPPQLVSPTLNRPIAGHATSSAVTDAISTDTGASLDPPPPI